MSQCNLLPSPAPAAPGRAIWGQNSRARSSRRLELGLGDAGHAATARRRRLALARHPLGAAALVAAARRQRRRARRCARGRLQVDGWQHVAWYFKETHRQAAGRHRKGCPQPSAPTCAWPANALEVGTSAPCRPPSAPPACHTWRTAPGPRRRRSRRRRCRRPPRLASAGACRPLPQRPRPPWGCGIGGRGLALSMLQAR